MYHHADHLGMMVFVVYSRCQAFLRLTRSFGRGGRFKPTTSKAQKLIRGSKMPAQQLARRMVFAPLAQGPSLDSLFY